MPSYQIRRKKPSTFRSREKNCKVFLLSADSDIKPVDELLARVAMIEKLEAQRKAKAKTA